jgi:hypothetical protein
MGEWLLSRGTGWFYPGETGWFCPAGTKYGLFAQDGLPPLPLKIRCSLTA